jgi:hypothetical protein
VLYNAGLGWCGTHQISFSVYAAAGVLEYRLMVIYNEIYVTVNFIAKFGIRKLAPVFQS